SPLSVPSISGSTTGRLHATSVAFSARRSARAWARSSERSLPPRSCTGSPEAAPIRRSSRARI
ncbi:hypothetical protein AAVH_41056, partial [Aphelenchoides avenae]